MRPKHRGDELVIKHLNDEVLVYDVQTGKAHALNGAAAMVFELCDGTREIQELIERIAEENSATPSEAAAIVTTALELISHRGLLEQPVERIDGEQRLTRRRVIQQLVTAAVAIPVIVSLTAPFPVAAQSSFANCLGADDFCTPGGTGSLACCSGLACIARGQQNGQPSNFRCTQ